MESPVWTPIGSRFSMLQTVMHVSAASRITSYSISFQPHSERSMRTWWIGDASRPRWATAMRSASVVTNPPPVPPSVYAGRITTGRPILFTNAVTSSSDSQTIDVGTGSPMLASMSLKACRSSALRMVSMLARADPLHNLDRERLEIDAVRDLLVGHDRRRVGVDQDRYHPLLAQGFAGLRARIVELRRLADNDRPRAQDEDLLRFGCLDRATDGPQQRSPVAHHLDEAVVQVLVVLGAGTTLGVVLDAERGQRPMAETLDRAVVQVALRDEEIACGNRLGIDLELVILA